jgi:putative ABC transport system permease protein
MRTLSRYTLRSLAAEPALLGGALAVATVVAGFLVTLGMVRGMRETITTTATPGNLIVTSRSSRTEVASSVTPEELAVLRRLVGTQGTVAPELIHLMFFDRPDGGRDNLVVRGVTADALRVHPRVRIVEGRAPRPGRSEVMVGRRAADTYVHTRPGDHLAFGRRTWTVVGTFEAGGSSLESELWNDLDDYFADSFSFAYSLAVVHPNAVGHAAALQARLEADAALAKLRVVPEPTYYAEQRAIASQLEWLALVTIVVLLVAAFVTLRQAFAILVGRRRHDRRTARALGIRTPLLHVVLFAQVLAVALLGLLGGVGASLAVDGVATSYASFNTYATLLFGIDVTPALMARAALVAVALVAAGALDAALVLAGDGRPSRPGPAPRLDPASGGTRLRTAIARRLRGPTPTLP